MKSEPTKSYYDSWIKAPPKPVGYWQWGDIAFGSRKRPGWFNRLMSRILLDRHWHDGHVVQDPDNYIVIGIGLERGIGKNER